MTRLEVEDAVVKYAVNESKPLLLYNLSELKRNINKFLYLKEKYGIMFVFPVKAFPCNTILDILYNNNFGFEVSNQGEYSLVKKYTGTNIIINDPTAQFFLDGKKIINVFYSPETTRKAPFGIRVNFNECLGKNSRFGISNKYICDLGDELCSQIECLHFHVASTKKYDNLKNIIDSVKELVRFCPNLRFIDIGGNWDGQRILFLESFLEKLRMIVAPGIKIIFEAGEFWFQNVGYGVAKVMRCQKSNGQNIVVTNLSKILHCNWSTPLFLEKKPGSEEGLTKNIFYGPTCYELDFFEDVYTKQQVCENDIIIMRNINGYSYAFNNEFNGIQKAEVIFYDE